MFVFYSRTWPDRCSFSNFIPIRVNMLKCCKARSLSWLYNVCDRNSEWFKILLRASPLGYRGIQVFEHYRWPSGVFNMERWGVREIVCSQPLMTLYLFFFRQCWARCYNVSSFYSCFWYFLHFISLWLEYFCCIIFGFYHLDMCSYYFMFSFCFHFSLIIIITIIITCYHFNAWCLQLCTWKICVSKVRSFTSILYQQLLQHKINYYFYCHHQCLHNHHYHHH